jgi:asparagine synthase (glutamine-hydrolysing)
MCGIAGVLVSREVKIPELQERLAAFSKSLAHRGPDASGIWISPAGTMGLAHRRLSIIDVAARSDQPMHSGDGRYTLVYNGEIYNYRELRRELEQKGRHFVTTGDTEVLLEMFAEYGVEMLKRLRGMYALGIWDEQTQELVLARDPMGIKPLYYADSARGFLFASQVKTLMAAPGVDLREQPAGHVGFFVWGSVPEPYTLYRGIHCLPGGSWVRVTRQGRTQPKLFSSPVEATLDFNPADMPRSEGEANERLHDALKETVQMHEIADVPVAIFLSAGIDSGLIAALAAEAANQVETLTLGFDLLRNTSEDETEVAQRVAEHYELPHYATYIDRSSFLTHRERLLERMDQPTIDGVNTYFISWLARERGFKVALSGLGGDELFGSYPSFRQIPLSVHTLGVASAASFLGRAYRVVTAPGLRRLTSPKYASLFEYGGTWGGAYLLRRGLFLPWELPEFLDPDLVREGWRDLGGVKPMNALVEPFAKLPDATRGQADFLRVSALETTYYMRSQLLRDADWAGMAHSVEIRVPLVDIELTRRLAPLRASRFSPRKPGMLHCLRDPLPAEILNRPKSGFNIPVREWMQETPERGLRHWARFVHGALTSTVQRPGIVAKPSASCSEEPPVVRRLAGG